MTIIEGIFLGLLQGLAEFLPVSSSGHLLLAMELFSMSDGVLLLTIILHLATLLAVVIVFHKRIWELIKNPFSKTGVALMIATVITVAFVLLFKDVIDSLITVRALPITFLITAILLFSTTFFKEGDKEANKKTAIATGLAQGIAVVPGFSRSGFTISAAMATGTKRTSAAEFSFLMSIPIIIASFVYEVIGAESGASISILPTVVAFIVALVTGVFAIKFMLHIIRKISLGWFSLYLVVLAIITAFVVY